MNTELAYKKKTYGSTYSSYSSGGYNYNYYHYNNYQKRQQSSGSSGDNVWVLYLLLAFLAVAISYMLYKNGFCKKCIKTQVEEASEHSESEHCDEPQEACHDDYVNADTVQA